MITSISIPFMTQAEQVSQSRASQITGNCVWTPRVTFWIAATMALPVWIISVSVRLDVVYCLLNNAPNSPQRITSKSYLASVRFYNMSGIKRV